MTAVRTIEYVDFSQMLDALDDTRMAFEVLGATLEMSLRTGEDMHNDADGIYILIQTQCDDLKFLISALAVEYNDVRAGNIKLRDLDMIVGCAGVPRHIVKRVVEVATGIKLSGAPEPSPADPVSQFHEAFGGTVAPENGGPGVSK